MIPILLGQEGIQDINFFFLVNSKILIKNE